MTKKELENEVEMLRVRVAVLEAITRDYWIKPPQEKNPLEPVPWLNAPGTNFHLG